MEHIVKDGARTIRDSCKHETLIIIIIIIIINSLFAHISIITCTKIEYFSLNI